MYRHGYEKANSSTDKEWPIMEVKDTDDPYADPWDQIRESKRTRVEKIGNNVCVMKNVLLVYRKVPRVVYYESTNFSICVPVDLGRGI